MEQIVQSTGTTGNLNLDLKWGASWKHNERFHCTLSIMRDYFDNQAFSDFLLDQFGDSYGSWKYDKHIHGVEVWFKNKEDMLAFKLLAQSELRR